MRQHGVGRFMVRLIAMTFPFCFIAAMSGCLLKAPVRLIQRHDPVPEDTALVPAMPVLIYHYSKQTECDRHGVELKLEFLDVFYGLPTREFVFQQYYASDRYPFFNRTILGGCVMDETEYKVQVAYCSVCREKMDEWIKQRNELNDWVQWMLPEQLEASRESGFLNLGEWNLNKVPDLRGQSHLRSLDLSSNRISDPSPLSSLGHLREVSLRDNEISDPSSLAGLSRLTFLDLSRNPIPEARMASLRTALPDCKIYFY